MPELVPTYDRLVELAGGGDLAARVLSLVDPPPYLAACSQGVWTDGEPFLVRNYDYLADRVDGVIWYDRLDGPTGHRHRRQPVGPARRPERRRAGGLADVRRATAAPVTASASRSSSATCSRPARPSPRPDDARPPALPPGPQPDARGPPGTVRHCLPRPGPAAGHRADRRSPPITRTSWTGPSTRRSTRSHEREALIAGLLADPAVTPDAFADAFLVPPICRQRPRPVTSGRSTRRSSVRSSGPVEYRWPTFALAAVVRRLRRPASPRRAACRRPDRSRRRRRRAPGYDWPAHDALRQSRPSSMPAA